MARCETASYRGRTVCKHSVHKYDAVAAGTGSTYRLTPIQGSYTTSNSKSAGTHGGGGAMDHELDGYSWTIASMVSRTFRSKMFLEWIRWWTGNHHGHVLDPECPNLSPEAVAQFVEFGKGGDGLVGDDKDPGDRTNASKIMTLFNNRRSNPSRVKLIQRGLGVAVDGVWGSATETAISKVRASKTTGVKAVQTGLLVDADGVWGSVTESAYKSLRTAMYKPPTTTVPAPAAQEGSMQLSDELNLRTNGEVSYSSETTTVEGILISTNYYTLQGRDKILKELEAGRLRDEAILAAVKGLNTSEVIKRIEDLAANAPVPDVDEAALAAALVEGLAPLLKGADEAAIQRATEQAVRTVFGSLDED